MHPSEPPNRLESGLPTKAADRMLLTHLTGRGDRWVVDQAGGPTPEQKADLLAVTSDPRLWGAVLGRALRRVELGSTGYLRLVELAREAGADEEVAQTHLAWLRAQPGT